MKTPICEMFDIEFPLIAFTHCRDVVVAVSKAGGMGVFGAVAHPPDRLEEELRWIDEHIEGKPYGIDLIVPNKMAEVSVGGLNRDKVEAAIPQEYFQFAAGILAQHDIPAEGLYSFRDETFRASQNMQASGAAETLEVAFSHPIKLVANALGVPPTIMLEMGKQHGVHVAALVGAKKHAIRQVQAGVDVLIAAGGEAGGHCGDVSTMVLIPEIHEAIQPYGNIPILAAGGIVTGRQMAACMAMGAAGVWTGSVWLTTSEAETNPIVKEKMLHASSRDTVRSKARTGKYSRQLRSPWTDAWEAEDSPTPLPMPLQSLVTEPALGRVDKLSQSGHAGAKELTTYWVGQGVGLMNRQMSAAAVVQEFKEDFFNAFVRLSDALEAE
jgi:NAD(P)H-dependent flavin oxidoreductase YrpB (nitropropane dioxygenase family)